jgi:putative molybdopterin biosynthesis protein
MPNDSLSVQEVADLLGISKNTVYDLIKRKQIPSYRVGHKLRVDSLDIEKYKTQSKTVPATVTQDKKEVKIEAYNLPSYHFKPSYTDGLPLNQKISSSPSNTLILCGQDMLMDIIASHLDRPPHNIPSLRSYIGSYNGLVELYKGNVSVTSAHLWDSTTNAYNIPYLHSLLPGLDCVVVNLTYRMQGFYVAKGNPKNIQTWQDLLRPDVSMLNRELGCGVRVLIDESLKKNKIDKNFINGYYNTDFSHISVASAVARGDIDVAIGNEKTSHQVDNIGFVPIQKERLDLIIPKDNIFDPRIQAIIAILKSPAFKSELSGIGGYDTIDTGKILVD